MLISIATAKAASIDNMSKIEVEKTTTLDELNQQINNVRVELAYEGFSKEMMNNLFGEENLYFPSNCEKLETVIYIVDLLIKNKQYEEADKDELIRLSNQAYIKFMNLGTDHTVVSQSN